MLLGSYTLIYTLALQYQPGINTLSAEVTLAAPKLTHLEEACDNNKISTKVNSYILQTH